MFAAATGGHHAVVHMLLEAKADPYLRDRERRSALSWVRVRVRVRVCVCARACVCVPVEGFSIGHEMFWLWYVSRM